jgi:uncharacterized protein YcbX
LSPPKDPRTKHSSHSIQRPLLNSKANRSTEFIQSLPTTPTIDLFGTNVRPRVLAEQSSFFAAFLSVPSCKLVYLGPDPRAIIINKPPVEAQSGRTITTAFADAGPYLLATEESFADVNEKLEKKLGIIRFRPNIVVGGTMGAWDEDQWKEITVGNVGRFFCVARCPRCQLPKYLPLPIPPSRWGLSFRGVVDSVLMVVLILRRG